MKKADESKGRPRLEHDSMGEVPVPAGALYGASTARAVENFPLSGRGFPPAMIRALGLVKLAAVRINRRLGLLDDRRGGAIEKAAAEVAANLLDAHFVVDVFQTGSGTSTNMNANEVIAHRAAQILGEGAGARTVHPNDHVNLGQSSNDVFPTALRVAAVEAIERRLLPALERLEQALAARARAFPDVLKVARTHLQDAVPMRLGQELGGYASQVEHAREHIRAALPHLRELPLGGTAVGTGINTPRSFGRLAAAEIARETGLEFHEARNHFEAQAARDAEAAAGGALTAAAVGLMKIANDVRLLAMGPRSGIAEIRLPALQPGSSIMPGKVNPVICEAVIQVGAQVQACNLAIQLGAQWGQLELNAMMPLIARNLLEAIDLLANAAGLFASRCIDGLEPDPERCRELMERSLALATALSPALGYDAAAEVASEALRRGLTLRQVLRERRLLSEAEIDRLLDPARMTEPDEDPPERGAAEGR